MWSITSKSLWYNPAMVTADSVRCPAEERPRGHLEEEKAVVIDIRPRTVVHTHRTGADTGCTRSGELQAERTAASTISRARESNTPLPSRKNPGGRRGGTKHLPCNTNFMSRFLGGGQQNGAALESDSNKTRLSETELYELGAVPKATALQHGPPALRNEAPVLQPHGFNPVGEEKHHPLAASSSSSPAITTSDPSS